ncbi:MAG TPA: arabinofuranosidase catalytic domain-containing protein [Polyangiaceae bacterium]|nr:arabinofuranosidase catalytic domain-containing protein [Polyangiaceae bacterium]
MKRRPFPVLAAVPVCLAAVGMSCFDYSAGPLPTPPEGGGSTAGAAGSPSGPSGGAGSDSGGAGELPCDVLDAAGHPCVSAHSTVRVLVRGYGGPLYQVENSRGMTLEIGSVGGYADSAAQDAFCSGGGCVINVIYDQSPMGNDLTEAPPGSAKPTPGKPVNAADLPLTIGGHAAYGILIRPGMGYRDVTPSGTAVLDEPQTVYMVSSQHDLINGCCFDYGSAETTANNDGNGTMEAVYLGLGVIWGTGSGAGPWVMADLENGLYPGWENGQDRNISTNTPLLYDFVTAVVVGDTADKNQGKGRFALYGGDATTGALQEMYDGIRPEKPGYVPMRKQGSIILGIGGDNSNGGAGRFYEGVMANGAATRETVDALQAAIVAAGYGR